jgi:hypothetical protein
MVGLIENMTHIDDYQDTSKLQLPLDTNDFKKNWKITGTGATVVRGWSKWHWATDRGYEILESSSRKMAIDALPWLVILMLFIYFTTHQQRGVSG